MLQEDNDLQVTDIKAFVPSKNYAISKAFYTDIGFDSEYVSDDLTLFWNGECQLFLQRFYNQDSAYSKRPLGRGFFVWGPASELLHVTQLNDTK
jgi:hypothetical protein